MTAVVNGLVAVIRARHGATTHRRTRYCAWCSVPWPCHAVAAADLLDAIPVDAITVLVAAVLHDGTVAKERGVVRRWLRDGRSPAPDGRTQSNERQTQ